MGHATRVKLEVLTTGVPGLDTVLGGGLPELSFNLIVGAPGAGKTTLVHQLMFANATEDRPALYFTIVGEPALKMLRYQQQMDFFEPAKLSRAIRYIDLSQEVNEGNLDKVLETMVQRVAELKPAIVVVDSFRSLVHAQFAVRGTAALQSFLQYLAIQLATWNVTSLVIASYGQDELADNPILTIADSILVLSQHRDRNSVVRKLEVVKMRGMASIAGLHTFRISSRGVHVFPRNLGVMRLTGHGVPRQRATLGIAELDAMLGGGLPVGDATIIAGPSGTGKTVLGTHFIAEGIAHDEHCVAAVFEEHPDDYLARAADMGFDLPAMVKAGKLELLQLRPLDLSADEILFRIQEAVDRMGACRLVIDSLNGLEIALAPTFRDDFRESFYRMISGLTGGGISVVLTIEVPEVFTEIAFSPHAVSFLSQNIIFLRYVELESQLRRMLTVVKMRRSSHSRAFHEYEITASGLRMLGPLTDYRGLLSGTPVDALAARKRR